MNLAYAWRIENFVKARKIIFEKGLLNTIYKQFRSGLVLFEDCGAYFTASVEADLKAILIRRRQLMIDVVMVANGFTDIPSPALTNATHYVLFKTTDNIDKRKNVIQDFAKIKEAQERIKKIAETDPHYYEIIRV